MSHKLCCCLSFHFQAAQIGPKKEEKEKVNGRMNKQVLEMNNSQDLIVNSPPLAAAHFLKNNCVVRT